MTAFLAIAKTMIRIKINKTEIQLPEKWEEISQGKLCTILEYRELKLAYEIYYWLVVRLLLDMPEGKWYSWISIRNFLMQAAWYRNIVEKRDPEYWAKWMLIMRTDEVDQLDILSNLKFLTEKPVVVIPPEFQGSDRFAVLTLMTPDKDGESLTFEQLVDAILLYRNFAMEGKIEDLDMLISTLYTVDNHGNYNPLICKKNKGAAAALPFGIKIQVVLWFEGYYNNLVAVHDLIFKKAEDAEQESDDPYGLVGFFFQLAGKQFGNLNELKKTPGGQVFDALQIELFYGKPKVVGENTNNGENEQVREDTNQGTE